MFAIAKDMDLLDRAQIKAQLAADRIAIKEGFYVVHWARGGLTELDNLITLCTFHHKLIHEYRWSVTLDHHQRPVWFRPSGRVYEPGPPPPSEVPKVKKDPPRLAEAIGYSRMFGLAAVL